MLVLNRKLFLTQQDLMDTQRDLAQARLALKAAVQTQEQAAPKLHSERQVQHDQQAQLQSSLLEALRERDAARTQQRLLEAQLNALTPDLNDDDLRRGLGTPAGRERYVLLGHARRRLLTRFGIDLSYAEMSDLDEQVRSSAPITRTWKMTPVKSAVVAGQTVYLIVTPDTEGHGTITTVYTRDLLEAQGALPTLNPALNQTSPGRDS